MSSPSLPDMILLGICARYRSGRQAGGVGVFENWTEEELNFLVTVDRYKRVAGRPFPSWSEVLAILTALGYRKVEVPDGFRLVKGKLVPLATKCRSGPRRRRPEQTSVPPSVPALRRFPPKD